MDRPPQMRITKSKPIFFLFSFFFFLFSFSLFSGSGDGAGLGSSPSLGQSPRSGATTTPRDSPRSSKLEKVTQELLQSERAYLKDVELLIQIYLDPLRRPHKAGDEADPVAGLLEPAEINGIFSNVEQVLGVNRVLLEALEKDHSPANVAAAFQKMAEHLKVYAVYCSNQEQSLKLIEETEKRLPVFKKWTVSNQQKFLSRGLDVRDFLIKPTQRICKYPLFLRELIDHSQPESETQQLLIDVNAKIQAIVSHINEQRRIKVGLEGVVEVYQVRGKERKEE